MQVEPSASIVSPSLSSFSTRDQFSQIATQFDRKFNLRGAEEEEEVEEDQQRRQQQQATEERKSQPEDEDQDEDELEDDGYEFSFVCGEAMGSPICAEDIFHNGQIKPIFPLVRHDFAVPSEPPHSLSSSSNPVKKVFVVEQPVDLPSPQSPLPKPAEEEDQCEGQYCLWARNPATEACRKSNSTGFSKLRRFRELLLQRSQSDGKDTFVFFAEKKEEGKGKEAGRTSSKKKDTCSLAGGECKGNRCIAPEKPKGTGSSSEREKPSSSREKGKTSEEEEVEKGITASSSGDKGRTASFMAYGNNGNGKGKERRRKSYLPYRQDLVGFFTNAGAISRNVHPY